MASFSSRGRARRTSGIVRSDVGKALVTPDAVHDLVLSATKAHAGTEPGYLLKDQLIDEAGLTAALGQIGLDLSGLGVTADLSRLSPSQARWLQGNTHGALSRWVLSQISRTGRSLPPPPNAAPKANLMAVALALPRLTRPVMDTRVMTMAVKVKHQATLGQKVNPPLTSGFAVMNFLIGVQAHIKATDHVVVNLGMGLKKDYDELASKTFSDLSNWAFEQQEA